MLNLTVEINQKCPNSCLFCSSLASSDSQNLISFKTFETLIRQASSLGLDEISISGGEPLVHPEFFDLMLVLADFTFKVNLYTSGQVFVGGSVKPFSNWSQLKKGTNLIFNLQSIDEQTHDTLTKRQGSFARTFSSIKAAKNEGFKVEIHIVPNKLNLSTLLDTVVALSAQEIDQISFLRLVPQGFAQRNKAFLTFDNQERLFLQETFLKMASLNLGKTKLRFGIPFASLRNEEKTCNAGTSKLIIRYDGKIFPCEAFKEAPDNHNYILGDVHFDNLEHVWKRTLNHKSLMNLKKLSSIDSCPAQTLFRNELREMCQS